MNGANQQEYEGRVEVYEDERWRTLCPWLMLGTGASIARVVCRSLGFPGALAFYRSSADLFGVGDYRSAVDTLNCSGLEHNLTQCYHELDEEISGTTGSSEIPVQREGPCIGRGALGVSCTFNRTKSLEMRLDYGRNRSEGIPQVNIHDRWVDIQARDITFVRWMCHSLGLDDVHSISNTSVADHFLRETYRITFDRINCTYPSNAAMASETDYDTSDGLGGTLLEDHCIFEDDSLASPLQYTYGCQLPDVSLSEATNIHQFNNSHQGFVVIELPGGPARPVCVSGAKKFPDIIFGHAVCFYLGYDEAVEMYEMPYDGEPAEDFYTGVECSEGYFETCILSKVIPDSTCPGNDLVYVECKPNPVKNTTDDNDLPFNDASTADDSLCSLDESQCEAVTDLVTLGTSDPVQNTDETGEISANGSLCSSDKSPCEAITDAIARDHSPVQNTTDVTGLSTNGDTSTNDSLCSSDKSSCEAVTDSTTGEHSPLQNTTDESDFSNGETSNNDSLCSSDRSLCETIADVSSGEHSDPAQNGTDRINLSVNDTQSSAENVQCSPGESQCEADNEHSSSGALDPVQNTTSKIDLSRNNAYTTAATDGNISSSDQSHRQSFFDITHSETSVPDSDAEPMTIIRLVDGDPTLSHDGWIEIYTEGAWKPVCSNVMNSDIYDVERIACSSLGLKLVRVNLYSDQLQGTGAGQSGLDVSCPYEARRISQCSWIPADCTKVKGATCLAETPSLRLANGSSPNQGRLEVFIGGSWRIICSVGSRNIPHQDICRELGFEAAKAVLMDGTFGSSGEVFADRVLRFDGQYMYGRDDTTVSPHEHVVGLDCLSPGTQIKVDSSVYQESNILAIALHDVPRPICLLSSFTSAPAQVMSYQQLAERACQRLGFSGVLMLRNVELPDGGWTRWFTYVSCPAYGSLEDCLFLAWTLEADCTNFLEVTCYTGVDFSVRLQGEEVEDNEGWIQLSMNQSRYTGIPCGIQPDEFYHTACRNLGYPKALYGTASGPAIWGPGGYGRFECPVAADKLTECLISRLSSDDCLEGIGSSSTPGVICDRGGNGSQALPVRLVDGSESNVGRVEIKIFNEWTSVCSTPVTRELTFSLCIALGYMPYDSSSGSIKVAESGDYPGYYITYGTCSDPVDFSSCFFKKSLITEECLVDEDSIRHDLIISCSPEPFNPCKLKGDHFPCDINNGGCLLNGSNTPVCWCKGGYQLNWDGRRCDAAITEVRLLDGTGPSNGRLEVNFKGSWRSACSPLYTGRTRRKNLDIICQMMGFKRMIRVTETSAQQDSDGPESVNINEWTCWNSEKSIQDCPFYANHHTCQGDKIIHLGCLTDEGINIRLTGPGSPTSGRLELALPEEQFGVICFERNQLEVTGNFMCEALGSPLSLVEVYSEHTDQSVFASYSTYSYNTVAQDDDPFPYAYFIKEEVGCRSAVGLSCFDMDVRMGLDSGVPHEGRPEIFDSSNSSWNEVCIDNMDEANWFCSLLGFDGAYGLSYNRESRNYHANYVALRNHYSQNYFMRKYSAPSSGYCYSGVRSVICNANQTVPLRLADGAARYEGRIEVKHIGEWTPIVICSSLYFSSTDKLHEVERSYWQLAERFTNGTCSSLGYSQADSWSFQKYSISYNEAVFVLTACESSNVKSCRFGRNYCNLAMGYTISALCRNDSFNPCMQEGVLYPCDPTNGGCIALSNGTHLCTCPSDMLLGDDNRTCIPAPTQPSPHIVSGSLPSELQESFDSLKQALFGDDDLSNQTASESVDSSVAVAQKLDTFLDDMLEANITDLLHVVQDGIELMALAMDTMLDVQSIRFGVDNESRAALPEISIPIAALLGGGNGSYLAGAFAVIKFNSNDTDPVHHNISDSSQSGFLNSDVVSIKLSGVNTSFLKENVTISFPLAQPSGSGYTPHCSFLELEVLSQPLWSLRGCTRKGQENATDADDVITCSCNHLTNFAVLMLTAEIDVPVIHVPESPDEAVDHAFILSVLTYVGLSFSIISLILSLAAFFISRIHSTRLFLMKNQCLVMILAQLLFVTGVEHAKGIRVLCGIIAGGTHLLFLGVFMWMLNQGLYIILQLGTRCLAHFRLKRWQYLVIGWSVPVMIVGITLAVDYRLYMEGSSCWLATSRGGIYAFIAPVIFILLCNMGIFLYAIIAFTSVKAFKNKSEKDKIRSTLRAVSVLCPTLGLTWVLGLFVNLHISLQYSFVILNSSQGVLLFIFQVLLNDEVFVGVKRRLQRSAVYPLATMKEMSVTDSKSMSNQTQSTGAGGKVSSGNSGTMNMEVISLQDDIVDSLDGVKAQYAK